MTSRRALALACSMLSLAGPALAVEKAAEQVLPFYGSFSYSVPIEVPPFRGLEPRLALAYSSEGRNGFAGAGWNLAGFSTIERANAGRGTPNYNASDIFLLDGQELYPCQAGSVSPSCTSGGNYSTKVDSYLKIRFDAPSNWWTVWSKTGIRSVFTPVYTTTSGTLRWGQTSTVDTRDNTVSSQWQCSNGDCYPWQISYGSYRVTFYREARTVDVISFATGPALGRMRDRLRSVVVSLNGVSNIRAYKLSYTTSTVTGQSLLASVQQYGKDVAVDGSGLITGGSALPAHTFTYQNDPAAKSFTDLGSVTQRQILTENVSWAFRTNTSEAGAGNSLQKVNGLGAAWDAGASSTRAIVSGNGYVEATSTDLATYGKRWGLSRDDPSVSPAEIDFAFEEKQTWLYVYEDGVLRGYWPRAVGDLLRIEVGGNVVRYKQNGNLLYTSAVVPVYPLRVDASVYQMLTTISNVVISGQLEDVSYWCWGNTFLQGDFNGDGRTDQACYSNAVQTTRVKLANGTGFAQPAVWQNGPLNLPFTGDFDADGKTDLGIYDAWNGTFSVSLSTGTAFGAFSAWGTASVPGYGCDHATSIMWTGDFNGDGITDVACRHAGDPSPQGDARVLVGRSTGSSFSFSMWANLGCDAPAYERTGALDLNGDGKDDLFCISQNGYFSYYASTGSGFDPGFALLGPTFCGSSADYVFGDYNGDGRTDVHCKLNGAVALAAGSSYVVQGTYGGWCTGTAQSTDVFAADVDGDGASELVCNNADVSSSDIQVRKWSDSGLGAAETWRADWCKGKVQPGDFNGDNKTDLYCDDLAKPVIVAGTSAIKADLMTSSRNPIGGTAQAVYTVSSNFSNQTPTVKQVVASVIRNDGRGGISTKTYAYSGGLMDYKERRFLGFRYVRESKPCIFGEAACPYTETWFVQDAKTGPKPERVDARDGAGGLFRSSVLGYATNSSTIPYTSLLTGEWLYTYAGATSECTTWPCTEAKRVRVTHDYDAYGNETLTTKYGEYDTANDESTVSRVFVPNTSAYIVGLVAQETEYAGVGTLGTQLRQTRYHYDSQAAWNTPPLQGYLTRAARWLDTTGGYINRDRTYDGWGNLIQDKDETNVATNFTIDPTYHLFVASTYVIPAETTSYLWDPVCSQVSQETNVNNQLTTAQYDAFCRPWQVNGPLGSFRITTYPSYGDPANQNVLVETPSPDPTDGTGNLRERTYFDGFGRRWRTVRKSHITGGAIFADTAYTARGTVASQTAPYYYGDPVYTTTYSYDAMDRRTETRFPDNAAISTTYGLLEETQTDPESHEDVRRYDAHGRVISKEPEGHLTTLQYDALGNLVSMTDPMSNDWFWEYDSLGRMTEQDDPDSGPTTFQYDAAGRLRFRTDAKGQETEYTYSIQTGRLTTKANAAGTIQYSYGEARFSYFNVGQLTTVTDPASTLRFDYDALGHRAHASRVLDGTTYEVSRVFDSGGRLRSINYPDGDSIGGLVYDAANRLKTVPGIFSGALYDASDRPTQRSNGNGTTTTWTYDAYRGWLESIVTTGPTGTIQNLEYSHSGDGLLESVTSPFPDEAWSYGYDAWHRLTSATATNPSTPSISQTFQYDATGGITYNSLAGSYLYQDPAHAHAPSSVVGQSYTYDLNGNLLSGGGRTITWNADNLPTIVAAQPNGMTSFTYDGLGSRVKKVSGSTTSRYPFADDYEVTNGVVTKYINVEGMGVVAKRTGSPVTTYWLHTDRLGSIQAVTDSGGNQIQRRTYRAYGDKIAETTTHVESRGYIDQRQDPETGLTYLHARSYDSRLGVFLSPDPSPPTEPGVGPNRYAYALGNPLASADRSGLMMLCEVMGGSIDFNEIANSAGRFAGGPWAPQPSTIHVTINLVVDCTDFNLGPLSLDQRVALLDRGRPGVPQPGDPPPAPATPLPPPVTPPTKPPSRQPDPRKPERTETSGMIDGMERSLDEMQQVSTWNVFAQIDEARRRFPDQGTRPQHCWVSCVQVRQNPELAYFPTAESLFELVQFFQPNRGPADSIGDILANGDGVGRAFVFWETCEDSCRTSPLNGTSDP